MHCPQPMRTRMFLLFFLAFLILPSVFSLTLSGRQLSPLAYQPGTFQSNHYTVSETSSPVQVTLNPGPFSNITITPVVNNEFDLLIDFPEKEHIPTGTQSFSLLAQEIPDGSQGGIGSSIAVSKVITVIVYSYQKEVEVRVHAPSVNQGSNTSIQLSVISQGYPDIEKVSGEVSILDFQGRRKAKLGTEERPLPGLKDITFTLPIPSSSWESGNYSVQARVSYDGKNQQANTSFLIGEMDVGLTSSLTRWVQGFNSVNLTVVNRWGNPLRNVYARIYLTDQEVLHTPSIDLGPWEEGILQGIARVDAAPVRYSGKVQLFYEGEQKEFPFSIEVVAPPPPPPVSAPAPTSSLSLRALQLIVFSSSSAALILVVVVVVLYRKGKRPEEL